MSSQDHLTSNEKFPQAMDTSDASPISQREIVSAIYQHAMAITRLSGTWPAPERTPSASNDIVAELRSRYECTAGYTREIYAPEHRKLDLHAADEIERLTLKLQQVTHERDVMLEDIAALRMAERLNVETVANLNKRLREAEELVIRYSNQFRRLRRWEPV